MIYEMQTCVYFRVHVTAYSQSDIIQAYILSCRYGHLTTFAHSGGSRLVRFLQIMPVILGIPSCEAA